MPVPYVKQTWADGAAGSTPISATRLGVIEQGIEDAHFPTPGYVLLEDEFWNTETADGEIGALGWKRTAGETGTYSYEPGLTDHPGIFRIATGSTSGSFIGIGGAPDAGDGFILPAQIGRVIWIVSPNSSNAGTLFRVGIAANPAGIPNAGSDGAYFDYTNSTSPNWRSVTRGASTSTTTTTGVGVTAGNWYKLEIRRLGNGNFEFYINDVLRNTHSTNLPSASLALTPFAVAETAAAASKQLDIDYFGFMSVALGNRYT